MKVAMILGVVALCIAVTMAIPLDEDEERLIQALRTIKRRNQQQLRGKP